jgi:sulfoxide reductase heme-binding subunit YedZ
MAALACAIMPGAVILYWYGTDQLGALPTKAAMKLFGLWCIRFVMLSLALTPLQRVLNWPRLAQVRRIAGVTAASYGAIHLALFFPYSGFDFGKIASELALRPYLAIGLAAFLGLAALGLTSTDAAMARLGRNWKRLHRLVYVIAPLGLLHFAMQEKLDATRPLQLLGLFALLMGYRLLIARRIALRPGAILLLGLAAAALTAAFEAAWYAVSSGIDPAKILLANASLTNGLRPAVLCLGAALLLSLAAAIRARRRQEMSAGILA